MSMTYPVKIPKKLIEVALPLDKINEAAAREKSIRHGHPSTLHLWWARRPLAAARAVIFGQMVNDPSWKWEMEHPAEIPPSNLKASWGASRKRLFAILEELVKWENTTNEAVLEEARAEIRKSWRETCELNKGHPQAAELFNPEKLPAFHDPFAGGGAIPLEAQRLGLETYASDLNPVAVLISKAVIEIPPKFTGRPPVNIDWQSRAEGEKVLRQWHGAQGLAQDVRYYGERMRDEAEKRIGHLYRAIEISVEMAQKRPDLKPLVGQRLTVIAWLWARTVKSPNPAFRSVDVPLASTFMLSAKAGKEAYVETKIEGNDYRFVVKVGKPEDPEIAENGTSAGKWSAFRCVMSDVPISYDYIRTEGQAGRLRTRLMAVVAEGIRGRVYLSPTPMLESAAREAEPAWAPDQEINYHPRDIKTQIYGLTKYSDLFTPRQLVALTTFSDLVSEARECVRRDALAAGFPNNQTPLSDGGTGAVAYADSVAVYLAFALSKQADLGNSLCRWEPIAQCPRQLFGRQAIPMIWDYAEGNPLGSSSGSWTVFIDGIVKAFSKAFEFVPSTASGHALQADAGTQNISRHKTISTDPPYYDNIGYADLSDFFYVWLRRSLRPVFPELFATLVVPKAEELVATPYRHGTKEKAERFFLDGMTQAMRRLADQGHPAFPVTIYYAFKQSESKKSTADISSTGWETFLEAVIRSGLAINGTWPMRTENSSRMMGQGYNALASSIVLVCCPRPANAPTTSRRTFLRELNQVLPEALDEMTRGIEDGRSPVAPVDLSQAIIGPGMAVFSKYAAVLEADGTPMTVRTALTLINRFLAEDDFDHDTQFCLHWFEQHGWDEGRFGEADTLARAKGTSVEGIKQAGVLYAAGGVVRLLKWADYPAKWEPASDSRLPVWEALHQLIRVFKSEGETGAGAVVAAVQAKAEAARQLAYRLYTLCERAGWAEDARAYNEIITSWSAIESAATRMPSPKQGVLFGT
jgi:putative DNA methylase